MAAASRCGAPSCARQMEADGGWRRILRGTVIGEPGKGVFRQDGRRVFERGDSPRELAGRTPFPECDRRSPPWSRRPPSADVALRLSTPPTHLRPNIPTIRAGTIPFQPPPAQYPYYMGRNSILPTSSGPPKSFIRAGGKTTETGRSTAQQSKRRERVLGEYLLRPGPSPEAPERSRKNADGQHIGAERGGRRGTAVERRKRRDRVQTEFV